MTLPEIITKVRHWYKNNLVRVATGVALGLVAGWLYYTFVGCSSGTCPLTSSATSTMLFMGAMGGLMAYEKPKPKSPLET